jgi:antirestriction protein
LGKTICSRFLQGLEYQLEITPDLISSPANSLAGATAAAFVALSFTYDIFPNVHGLFPKCSELFEKVRNRPAISEFYLQYEEGRKQMPWTVTEFGRIEYIRATASAHEESDKLLFGNLSAVV